MVEAVHRVPHPSSKTQYTISAFKMNLKKNLKRTNAVLYHGKR